MFYGCIMDEKVLGAVVRRFYERVRQDPDLAPIFNDAIGNWDHHLYLLTNFWSSVILTSGRYKGNPMAAHWKHASRISPPLFQRWLALWAESTAEFLDPAEAADIQSKAQRIAASLQLGLHHRAAA